MRVLITGGANGIGRATAEKLLENGHSVVVYDHDSDALQQLPDEIQVFEGDVADEEKVENTVDSTEFDVLVNSAGYYELGAVEDVDAETVEKHFETNVYGPMNFIRHSMPILRQRNGRVVNITSVAGRITMPFFGTYCGTKHALESITDALRMENHDTGVDVVTVEPGPVNTGFNRRAREKLGKYLPDSFYAERYDTALKSQGMHGVSPEKAAAVVVKAVEEENPKRRYTVTWQAWLAPKMKRFLPEKVTESIVKKMGY